MSRRNDGVRYAAHSGTWYTNNAQLLRQELDNYINVGGAPPNPKPNNNSKVIIAPHAGFSYSGPVAGHAYAQLRYVAHKIKTVFILGPSHHFYSEKAMLPAYETKYSEHVLKYEVPNSRTGFLQVDLAITQELRETNQFGSILKSDDEAEHSIEMQLPFIAQCFENQSELPTIVPIVVGTLDDKRENDYAQVLSKYLEREDVFFVISSDFCHWGKRFQYMEFGESYINENQNELEGLGFGKHFMCAGTHNASEVNSKIEKMDKIGAWWIMDQNVPKWNDYLSQTENTICGRHAISIMLRSFDCLKEKYGKNFFDIRLLKYDQSGSVNNKDNDGSVSYCAMGASLCCVG